MSKNHTTSYLCEVDIVVGLEQVATRELIRRLGKRIKIQPIVKQDRERAVIRFVYQGNLTRILQLKTVLSAYLVCEFASSHPSILLKPASLQRLSQQVNVIKALASANTYKSFGISAAGVDSPLMIRFQQALSNYLGIPARRDDFDLLFRIRRSITTQNGWDVLVRLSPRPLSVRKWRIHNVRGALNATIAHCMILLTNPTADNKFLNIACGSGTLLIERMLYGPTKRLIGCDIDTEMLEHATANVQASGYHKAIELYQWDARTLNLPSASVDVICADLPFGFAIGSHDENVELYPRLLQEAARVAKYGARFVLITHEVRLLQRLVEDSATWKIVQVIPIRLQELHPRIFVLQRR